ncbi:uncharacterized protein L969DRAFT_16194 [Mixia osmundae IAM 14324]|uniref:RGS domain-containing protein n=1 Tax=Mixia osmundae (strain CBS 9802 / IAM 14324 / JCM 22182 / KY 12970) TaxID=764103 RepID=G7E5A5_MIXOS|nr:uncharacterized protein L969DRAFT_16194 [Mixia osmundae IAM 14324]KEI40836.1 hypothetical protein L969DRAFT_16194 [Mixia osmundae IAM 14324]GAA98015.1 hypothetical protein E5Q_04695 [Mixia osmundae IAM 14324]
MLAVSLNAIARPTGPTRPISAPYTFADLRSLPARLLGSDETHDTYNHMNESDLEKANQSNGSEKPTLQRKVVQIRSLTWQPLTEVKLIDVLDNKHTPPFTLKEFEDRLVFVERSPENLYFWLWLRQYSKDHAAYKASKKGGTQRPAQPRARPSSGITEQQSARSSYTRRGSRTSLAPIVPTNQPVIATTGLSPGLAASFNKALLTFFEPTSRLELNLPAHVKQALLTDTVHSSEPTVFDEAKACIETALQESLNAFLSSSLGNSDEKRSYFAIALGLLLVLFGWIPIILSLRCHWHRSLRLTGVPLFFVGTVTLVAGLRQTCIVIYLFGNMRQLRSWELQRPRSENDAARPWYRFGLRHQQPAQLATSLPNPSSTNARIVHSPASTMVPSLLPTLTSDKTSSSKIEQFGAQTELDLDVQRLVQQPPLSTPTLVAMDHSNHLDAPLFVEPASEPMSVMRSTSTMRPLSNKSGIDSPADAPLASARPPDLHFFDYMTPPDDACTPRSPTSPSSGYFWQRRLLPSDKASPTTRSRTTGSPPASVYGKSAPVFAPLTPVTSPFVITAQRRTILMGMLYGLFVSIVFEAIALPLPI